MLNVSFVLYFAIYFFKYLIFYFKSKEKNITKNSSEKK